MTSVYNFIETNNNISKDFGKKRNTLLQELICEINEKVRSFVKGYKFHDVLGQFYGEFLRYANIDQGLGIVLTPNHIQNYLQNWQALIRIVLFLIIVVVQVDF